MNLHAVFFRLISSVCLASLATFVFADEAASIRPEADKGVDHTSSTRADTQNGSSSESASLISKAQQVTRTLSRRLPQADIGKPESLPVAGVYQIKVGPRYLYVTEDGRYAFVGDLVDLESGANLTDARQNLDNLALIETFPEQGMVVYPASDEERAKITVFTDTSCPFCRKLHAEVPQLQQAGVTVRYIAFPRAGAKGDANLTMRGIWCAKDRRSAMDAAKDTGVGDQGANNCEAANAVDAGYRLGLQIGIRGTPAIVLPDGSIQPGYLPASQIITHLQLRKEANRVSKVERDR